MSDFASMLKGLEATAKRAAVAAAQSSAAPTANDDSSNGFVVGASSCRARKRPRTSHPPPVRDRLTVTVNFMCIGAQKAGTTWLYEMLKRSHHHQIGLPIQKEVHFWDWHRRKGLGWYSQQYNHPSKSPSSSSGMNHNSSKILGEITPCYMALPERHVQEIHALFPHLKIIFLARDLVDRTYSAITMEVRNETRGLKPGEFDSDHHLDEATQRRLKQALDSKDDDFFMSKLLRDSTTHMDRSDYAAGLKKWLKYFSAKQILVLPFTDVADRPKELLNKVLQHIGVEHNNNHGDQSAAMQENLLSQKVNTAPALQNSMRPSLRRKLQNALRPRAIAFNQLLQQHWPEVDWALDEYNDKTEGGEEKVNGIISLRKG